MALVPFAHSEKLSVGIELELQLINLTDFDLYPASPYLLEWLGKNHFPGTVTPEITESMIEIASDVHTRYEDLLAQLRQISTAMIDACDHLQIGICGGGTHPFQDWAERKIFPKSRFQDLSTQYGYLAQQFTIFGQHIHIGCSSGDDALYLLHALCQYVPHFIALSASSPFVRGKDTQFQSARLNSVFAFPLSGRAPLILSWDEFSHHYFKNMEVAGIAKSMKDFYWDIRPKPEYGTVELRVCDTPLTVESAAALAAYLQTLCAYLLEHRRDDFCDDDYLVYNYNRFQACRFGYDGLTVHPRTYERASIRDSILATCAMLEPSAAQLGTLAGLQFLTLRMLQGNDAQRLRHVFNVKNNVADMVNFSMNCFRSYSHNDLVH